nr:MAG TPA: hypothetical protein [Caudoviricetes sp.]
MQVQAGVRVVRPDRILHVHRLLNGDLHWSDPFVWAARLPCGHAAQLDGSSECVECTYVEVTHPGQDLTEASVETAVGRSVVGEAELVDVLESLLTVEGEGPPGEAIAGVVGGRGGVQLGVDPRRGEGSDGCHDLCSFRLASFLVCPLMRRMSTQVHDRCCVEVAQERAVADEHGLDALFPDRSHDSWLGWGLQGVAAPYQHRQVPVPLDKLREVFDQLGGHQGLVFTHGYPFLLQGDRSLPLVRSCGSAWYLSMSSSSQARGEWAPESTAVLWATRDPQFTGARLHWLRDQAHAMRSLSSSGTYSPALPFRIDLSFTPAMSAIRCSEWPIHMSDRIRRCTPIGVTVRSFTAPPAARGWPRAPICR